MSSILRAALRRSPVYWGEVSPGPRPCPNRSCRSYALGPAGMGHLSPSRGSHRNSRALVCVYYGTLELKVEQLRRKSGDWGGAGAVFSGCERRKPPELLGIGSRWRLLMCCFPAHSPSSEPTALLPNRNRTTGMPCAAGKRCIHLLGQHAASPSALHSLRSSCTSCDTAVSLMVTICITAAAAVSKICLLCVCLHPPPMRRC